uniref:Pentatricopeptide repeat-containing protein n=1 Tax=Rhizophora mucronata TaxID=61149 RepID=A0A2P2Q7I1_RHIMU
MAPSFSYIRVSPSRTWPHLKFTVIHSSPNNYFTFSSPPIYSFSR